ncbi:hypothetical protein [Diaphorobacter ruginosibacter]
MSSTRYSTIATRNDSPQRVSGGNPQYPAGAGKPGRADSPRNAAL